MLKNVKTLKKVAQKFAQIKKMMLLCSVIRKEHLM